MRLLAGDIGGTNARLVLYEAPDDASILNDDKSLTSHDIVSQMYYKNNDFSSFTEVLCAFISLPAVRDVRIDSCCLAVAGPVVDNHINFTNREGWIIDGNSIMEEFNISCVVLVNDFVSNGHGLLSLSMQDLCVLQAGKGPGHGASNAPIALVGAGTGLGECFLVPDGSGSFTVCGTEGGHVEFAPRTKLELELLSFLQRRLDPYSEIPDSEVGLLPRVSVERLVSGKGLENIYEFLRDKFPDQVDEGRDAEYNASVERGRLIGGQKYNYKLFSRAIEIMFEVFGGEVGNVALKFLPYGGIYIAGGIAPKNIEVINGQESEFMRRFFSKGRVSSIMQDFPVYVVMKEDLGLRGAHKIASHKAAGLLVKGGNDGGTTKQDIDGSARESSLSLSEKLREAIGEYPLTYAIACSFTSALTAGAVVGGLQVLKKMKAVG